MSGITHTTPAGGRGVKIAKSSYNEVHTIADASIPIAKLSDHTKANHDSLDIDADTLDGHDASYFAVAGVGVTGGDTHNHDGGDGAQISHTTLSNIGTTTHADLDIHVAASAPHSGHAILDEDGKVPNSNLPFGYGETKLWNTALNDVPAGWHVCDGTNGTPDFSLVEPQASTDTAYIMYIGGEYTAMTARTIHVTNNLGANTDATLEDMATNTITAIEDGSPFTLVLKNTSGSTVYPTITCLRSSDDYQIMKIGTYKGYLTLPSGGDDIYLQLVQYVDCTWVINDNGAP